jgi:OHCU decarboxylase
VTTASPATLAALAVTNLAYDKKFGHIYIVCATGKTADEMLALAKARLGNDPATELAVAAEEQAKITDLRLERLVTG